MLDFKVVFICPFLHRKYPFWENLDQKKFVCLGQNLAAKLIQMWRSGCLCSSFCFVQEITLFGKFSPQNQTFLFKMELG